MSLKTIIDAIKSRYEEVKLTNPTRTHPSVVIDANSIGHKTPNGMETAKHVELLLE